MSKQSLLNQINSSFNANGREAINGTILRDRLLAMVNEMYPTDGGGSGGSGVEVFDQDGSITEDHIDLLAMAKTTFDIVENAPTNIVTVAALCNTEPAIAGESFIFELSVDKTPPVIPTETVFFIGLSGIPQDGDTISVTAKSSSTWEFIWKDTPTATNHIFIPGDIPTACTELINKINDILANTVSGAINQDYNGVYLTFLEGSSDLLRYSTYAGPFGNPQTVTTNAPDRIGISLISSPNQEAYDRAVDIKTATDTYKRMFYFWNGNDYTIIDFSTVFINASPNIGTAGPLGLIYFDTPEDYLDKINWALGYFYNTNSLFNTTSITIVNDRIEILLTSVEPPNTNNVYLYTEESGLIGSQASINNPGAAPFIEFVYGTILGRIISVTEQTVKVSKDTVTTVKIADDAVYGAIGSNKLNPFGTLVAWRNGTVTDIFTLLQNNPDQDLLTTLFYANGRGVFFGVLESGGPGETVRVRLNTPFLLNFGM